MENRNQYPAKPLALFIVGEPGIGKTSLVRALIAGRTLTEIAERFTTAERTNAPVKWMLAGSDLVLAGHYVGETFDGADGCDRDTSAHLAFWEAHYAHAGRTTVFDGDRFSIAKVKERLSRSATLRVVHLRGSEDLAAARRLKRGTTQSEPFVRNKRTKAANFSASFAPHERLELDAEEPADILLGKLLAWLDGALSAPLAPRLTEALDQQAIGGDVGGEPSEQSPLDFGFSVLVGETSHEAPRAAPAEMPASIAARGAGEHREPVPAQRAELEPTRRQAPRGTIASKVSLIAALLGEYAAELDIYAQGDRIVELVEIDGRPRPYPLSAEQLGLRIEWANSLAGNECPKELRKENEDEANLRDEPAELFVSRFHLATYGRRVLALHAWPGMRVLRNITYAAPGQPLGYDDETRVYYTKDTATEEIEAGTLALYGALERIGYFSAKMLVDRRCENWRSPRKTAAQHAAYDEVFKALAALPCAAYSREAALANKTVGEVLDLLGEKERSSNTGLQGQVAAVLRGLLDNRRHATEYGHDDEKLATYELVLDGKIRQLSTKPTTWHVERVEDRGPRSPDEEPELSKMQMPRELPVRAGSTALDNSTSTALAPSTEVRRESGLEWRESRGESGVRRLDLTGEGLLSVAAADALVGQFLDDTSYAVLLREESADVYKPDGSLLLSYRKGVLAPSVTRDARHVLRRAAGLSKNRGAAAGVATAEGLRRDPSKVIVRGVTASYLTADGVESNTNESNQVLSGIVGYFNATPRNPYCRTTAFSDQRLRRLDIYAMPLIHAIDRLFASTVPERHEAQSRFIRENRLREKGWVLGETAFSTITVNKDFRTAVHTDDGDYAPGFGNLTVIEGPHHKHAGGFLVFPRFRVAVDVREGDFLAMDVHEWHGNTELRSLAEGDDSWERVSVVCYLRQALVKCGTAEEESSRYERWLETELLHSPTGQQGQVAAATATVSETPSIDAPIATASAMPVAASNGYDSAAWPAFVAFAAEELRCGGLDPVYPVLRHIYDAEGVSEEIAVWRSLLYLAVYDLESATRLWSLAPSPCRLPPIGTLEKPLRFGTNRRGMRIAGHLEAHIESILTASGGEPVAWLRRVSDVGGEAGWRAVRAAAETVRQNGPYFTYKVADLLARVHGFAITADSIGDKPGCGPFAGMSRVTGLATSDCTVARQQQLLLDARAAGVAFAGLDQLETALCAFNALAKGDHYCGADIDVLQETIATMSSTWSAARRAVLPHESLGELRGRSGIEKKLLTRYRDAGEVVRGDGSVVYRRS